MRLLYGRLSCGRDLLFIFSRVYIGSRPVSFVIVSRDLYYFIKTGYRLYSKVSKNRSIVYVDRLSKPCVDLVNCGSFPCIYGCCDRSVTMEPQGSLQPFVHCPRPVQAPSSGMEQKSG